MVPTLTIFVLSTLSLYLVWTVLRPTLPHINSLQDWENKKHEVDPAVFQALLDGSEEEYLRRSLPSPHFRSFQRERMALALRSLDLVAENAAMLMKLGQLAKGNANIEVANEADELIRAALWLRVNLSLAQPCVWLKWLFPGWSISLPAIAMPYEELLTYLNRVRQQPQWNLETAVVAG
jgi:hypothetical protein